MSAAEQREQQDGSAVASPSQKGLQITAARLTPVGRGAVATIRVRGNFADLNLVDVVSKLNSLLGAANGIPLCEQPRGKIAFGRWGKTDAEELVVCRVDASTIEIHCHGGDAAVQRILNDLSESGCVIENWRGSTSAIDNFLKAECLEALTQTSTWRTTKIVLEQTNGLLKQTFQKLLQSNAIDPETWKTSLDGLLEWANFGLHLTMPWSVVLTGRPNVGKSSLINALLGYQRAIVFDQPGTTRDVVTGETAFEGWPIMLADTAGIRDSSNPLESAGIKLAHEKLRSADLRLILIDVSQQPIGEDFSLMTQWPDAIVVAHKSDLGNRWQQELPNDAIAVSSVTGEGLDELEEQIVRRLLPKIPSSGTPIPLTQRQVDRLRKAKEATSAEARVQALQRLIGAI